MIDRVLRQVLGCGLVLTLSTTAAFAQPANDECAAATAVTDGTGIAFDTTGATNGADTSSCGLAAPDIWFSYLASCTGQATLATTSGPGDDTIVEILDACGGTVIVCADDNSTSDFLSTAVWPTTSGTTYLVRVSGWNGASGAGTFDLSCLAAAPEECGNGIDDDLDGDTDCADADCATDPICTAPANDECAGAEIVLGSGLGTFTTVIETSAATTGADPLPTIPCTSDQDFANDVWLSFTPDTTGVLTVTTCDPAGFDSDVLVYSGTCGALVEESCNGDGPTNAACQDFYSLTPGFIATPGVEYRIRIGGWDANEFGVNTVSIDLSAIPAEDCADGLDNDFDGDVDCVDADCATDPACLVCPSFLSQNVDPATVDTEVGACSASAADHTDNFYFRSYDTSVLACPAGVRVLSVEVGIFLSSSSGGAGQPAALRIWSDGNGGAPDAGMTLLAEELLTIADGGARLETFPLTTPVALPVDATVVVEFQLVDSFFSATGHVMRLGTNAAGDTAATFLTAAPCGLDLTPIGGGPILNLNIDDQGAGVPGDDCEFALAVTDGANPFDSTGFSDSAVPGPTGCSNGIGQMVADIWFAYTATADGAIDIDTCDLGGFDTDLAVYDGTCGALNLISCDGDGADGDAGCQGFASRVTGVPVLAGSTYLIRVGGWEPGQEGAGTLNIGFSAEPPVLNEIRIDQLGADNDEFFELTGTPQSLDGLTLLVIGDDSAGSSGVIENVTDLTGQSIGPSGFFVAAESTFTIGTADLTTTLNFENSDNVTFLLVSGFTGTDGDDLDIDDDGVLDSEPWTSILDCVALIETVGSGDLVYCAEQVVGNGLLPPPAVERCPDSFGAYLVGSDNATLLDTDSPGAPNNCSFPPANDECLDATPALLGENFIFNESATDSAEDFQQADTGGPCGTGISKDLWYTFTAPADGTLVVDTCDLVNWDTNVEVYSGACDTLVLIGGSCDSTGCGGFTATSAPIAMTGGETYLLRVGGFAGDAGGFGIFDLAFTIDGDECDTALPAITGANPFDNTLATFGTTPDPISPCGTGAGGIENDIWFSYTAPDDGSITVSTCDSASIDTDLVIYTGTCAALTDIACNGDGPADAACQDFYSQVADLPVSAGESFLIRVGGWDETQLGAGTLTIEFTPDVLPPVASVSVAPLEGLAPLEVTLTDASFDGGDAAATLSIDWGDGSSDSGLAVGTMTTHSYAAGSYTPSGTVTNAVGSDTAAASLVVAIEVGDCNKDGMVDVADPLALANFLFAGSGDPSCQGACDTNGDGLLDIADVVYTLIYLFGGGSAPAPAAPGSGC